MSAKRLRVLAIGHSYSIAMNRGIVREVAQDPAFDITVAAPQYFHGDLRPITLDPEPPGSPLRVVGLPASRTRFIHVFEYDRSALKALLSENFDAVHAWEEPYIYAGYQIARGLRNSPSRFCFRTAQSYVKRYPPPFGYFERTVLARAQGWIAGASLVRKAMLERGFPESTGQVINLAVDLKEFQPLSEQSRLAVLQELGLKPPVVGFVGRFTKAKGLEVLMKAMEKLGSSQPWSLLLLGSGEYESTIVEWAKSHGWADRVKPVLVKHHEMPRYIGVMDMMVAPSQTMKNWREQFGRMIIEAFASAVPVIGSDSGEIPYVIGDAGRVVPEADSDAWAHAIEELLANAALREELKMRGLKRVPQFSTVAIAGQFRQFYRWLAAQPL